jgi:DNA-directed RNA polymerase subunit RPC12/RpoP
MSYLSSARTFGTIALPIEHGSQGDVEKLGIYIHDSITSLRREYDRGMSQDLEDAPLCSECGQPMEETTSANPQLHHGGVPFACQSNPDCPEYAPDGVGTVKAVNLLDIAENHTPNSDVVLQSFKTEPVCVQCGGKNLLMPDGITGQGDLIDDSTIICGECGATTTYGTIVNTWKVRVTDHLTDIGILGGTE